MPPAVIICPYPPRAVVSREWRLRPCPRPADFPGTRLGRAPRDEIAIAGIAVLRPFPVLPRSVPPPIISLIVARLGKRPDFSSESRYDKAFPILEKLLSEHPALLFCPIPTGDALGRHFHLMTRPKIHCAKDLG